MSFEPRNSPARRRRIAEGRLHVAALAATGCFIAAGTGIGVPAMAQDPVTIGENIAACDDAGIETYLDVDGEELECPDDEAGATDPSPSPPPPPAPAPPAPAAAPPPPPAAVAPPAPPADTPPPAADPPPPPSATAPPAPPAPADPVQTAGAPPAAPATPPPAPAAPAAQSESTAPADTTVTKHGTKAGSDAKTSKHAESKRGDKQAKRHAKRKHTGSDAAAKGSAEAALEEAVSYASLPASWTSLAPLTIPAFSVDGFPIPPFLLPIFQAAGAQYGVPWQVLASINEIETNFGRNAGISSAGAMGWMQFIYSSWERWGTDSDEDGRRDPRNPVDAIFAAARYLHDAGAGTDLPKAIFAYNHADWYVNQVVERAREFAGLDKTLVAALSARALHEDTTLYRARGNPFAGDGAVDPSPGQALLLTKRQLTRMVLHSGAIDIYPGGRQDIATGHIDRRVLATLVFLARSGLKPTVTSLTTGHSLMTTSGNVSAHSYGHAADIGAINGVPIMGHQGADSITSKTLDKLVQLQGYLQPNQIISLMTVDGHDNTLSMGDHDDHIHVGFPRVPKVPEAGRPADIRELVASLRARLTGH